MTDEATLHALLDAFNAHDVDRVMTFSTDDCVLETPCGADPRGTRSSGRAAVRDHWELVDRPS
jgi:ketosteroid isomerase-like protein